MLKNISLLKRLYGTMVVSGYKLIPVSDVADPSEWHVGGSPLLKDSEESDVQPRADEHGDLEVQADGVDLLLCRFVHLREV